MADWKQLLYRTDLTIEDWKNIPGRGNFNNLAVYKYYVEKTGIPIEKILEGSALSKEEFLDEKGWISEYNAFLTDLNCIRNTPGFLSHEDYYKTGQAFRETLPTLHLLYFILMSVKRVLKDITNVNTKFNNEFKLESYFTGIGECHIKLIPYPYFPFRAIGHECSFVRGVLSSNFELHNIDTYKIEEIVCSLHLERIINYFYADFNLVVEEKDGCIYIDGEKIAKKINLKEIKINNISLLTKEAAFADEGRAEGFKVLKNFYHGENLLLKKGNIYNAPYCLFRLTWEPLNTVKYLFTLLKKTLRLRKISIHEMERQIEYSNRQLFELNEQKKITINVLEKANQEKDDFLANTAHELKTPLNGIIGLGNSLLKSIKSGLPLEESKKFELILNSAKRLSFLVNDLLDYSRLKEHSIKLKLISLDISQVVSVTLENLEFFAGKKEIDIKNFIKINRYFIKGDEDRLYQVFFNVIGNAIKFSNGGKIILKGEIDKNTVVITVEDEGIGIPQDKLNLIFEPYKQASDHWPSSYGGNGIGLSVAKEIVELHGGMIKVTSKLNKGSIFAVSFPLLEKHEPGIMGNYNDVYDKINMTAQKKVSRTISKNAIWIVDDEPINLEVMESILKHEGYNTEFFHNGYKVLELLHSGSKPIMLLIDIMMPEINGLELCRRIREKYNKNELPVIMVTARTRAADLVACFSAGSNDFVCKPIVKDELVVRIRLHLKLIETHLLRDVNKMKYHLLEQLINLSSYINSKTKSTHRDGKVVLGSEIRDIIKPIITEIKESELTADANKIIKSIISEHDVLYKLLNDIPVVFNSEEDITTINKNIEKLVVLFSSSEAGNLNLDYFELSSREKEIARLVITGMQNSEIGKKLKISENTVKRHLYNIYNKAGVGNRAHLVFKLTSSKAHYN